MVGNFPAFAGSFRSIEAAFCSERYLFGGMPLFYDRLSYHDEWEDIKNKILNKNIHFLRQMSML